MPICVTYLDKLVKLNNKNTKNITEMSHSYSFTCAVSLERVVCDIRNH